MMPANLAARCQTIIASASLVPPLDVERGAAMFPAQIGITATLRFRCQEPIFNDGDDANYFYVLVEGAARLCKVRINGRRQVIRLLLAGDLFGFEIGTKHRLTAEALSDIVVRRCPRSYVDYLSENVSDTHRMLMASLYRELSTTWDHLVMIGRQSARERVASFLLLLHVRKEIQSGGVLELPMDREDFADYLGLTTETVSRTLTQLKQAGLIKILRSPRQIMVRDMGALSAVADGNEMCVRQDGTHPRSTRM